MEDSFLNKVNVDLGENWELLSTTLESFTVRDVTFVINHQRQRKYLFQDRPGGKGHEWQRNVFVSLIMGVPFPQFEVNKQGNKYFIEDGQQRYRTFQAITSDMVKLPHDLSKLGADYVDYQGMCFSELPTELQNKIFKTRILLLNGKNLSEEELHKRFLLINNGTPLTQQDKRSAQLSEGARYIQGIVDGFPDEGKKLTELSPDKNMFKMGEGEYLKVNVMAKGRALEEIVAHWYNTLHRGDTFSYNQASLNQLYKDFYATHEVKHRKRFEKILDEVDKCICNYGNRNEIKGRTLSFFWFIVKNYLEMGYKIDHVNLFKVYIQALSKLKTKDELITYTKTSGETERIGFKRLMRISSDMAQIKPLLTLIFEEMYKISNPTQLDSRRVFTREEKIAKLSEQNSECGYCGVKISIDTGYGDHMVPHSEGGETTMDNLVVSCKKCNEMKSNLPYNLWEKLIPELKGTNKELV